MRNKLNLDINKKTLYKKKSKYNCLSSIFYILPFFCETLFMAVLNFETYTAVQKKKARLLSVLFDSKLANSSMSVAKEI